MIEVTEIRNKLVVNDPEPVVLLTRLPRVQLTAFAQQGPQGSPASANDSTYVHTQILASTTWSVAHDLGKFPSVMVVDSGNNVVIGDIHYVDNNNLTITFSAAFSGRAFIN
jgi:hypothetical protein